MVVDLPALVYPTRATWGKPEARRCLLWVTWSFCTSLSFLRSWEICFSITRRFNSNLVSPAPRLVKPPPALPAVCWSSFSAALVRKRGSWYWSLAISTWSLASLVRAREAKISRIRAVRSITVSPVSCSRFRIWVGESSSLTIRASAACTWPAWKISVTLPAPK